MTLIDIFFRNLIDGGIDPTPLDGRITASFCKAVEEYIDENHADGVSVCPKCMEVHKNG